jgi:hypothetical protein
MGGTGKGLGCSRMAKSTVAFIIMDKVLSL